MRRTIVLNGNPYTYFKHCINEPGAFFLDSSMRGADGGFSYFGFSPTAIVKGRDLEVLRQALRRYRCRSRGLCGGGAVGYMAYDGSFYFGIYENIITIDHRRARATITAASAGEEARCLGILRRQENSAQEALPPVRIKSVRTQGAKAYEQSVRRALAHIRRGDIYQINLARKISMALTRPLTAVDAAAVYGALRQYSPSPFSAYFDAGDQIILSSSPERFLKLNNRIAQIRPMKGTRPRGATPAQDRRFKQGLLKSPKEIAELLMVTDLERNDLGRVCAFGSVKVRAMRQIERYAHVYQATATIEGRLRQEYDGIDLIKATFPPGSVTGCPKIEAMKIIERLERHGRGAYTGALGYIAFDGSMDFSVLIRSLFLRRGAVSFYVGSGIVADSDPKEEYQETCLKAKAMECALREVLRA